MLKSKRKELKEIKCQTTKAVKDLEKFKSHEGELLKERVRGIKSDYQEKLSILEKEF